MKDPDALVLAGFALLGIPLYFAPGWVAACIAVAVILGCLGLVLFAVMATPELEARSPETHHKPPARPWKVMR